MLYNIRTGYNVPRAWPMSDIVVLVSSLPKARDLGVSFVFTDRHAYLEAARDRFSTDLADLDRIDWRSLRNRDFRKDREDPERFERYQAEALIHRYLPVEALLEISCHSNAAKAALDAEVARRESAVRVRVRLEWYP
jgi:hypothetical protein